MSRAKTLPKKPVPTRKGRARAEASRPAAAWWASKNGLALLFVILSAVTIAVYAPAITHLFLVLDDREYVTANPHIRGMGWEAVKWAFTSTDAANWHPLTWLSHALDYKLFALNATGHHLDSVLLHAVNAALLFLGLAWITRRVGPSLLVAALFALHPINVESVAWIAERKNLLSTLLFLLSLGDYAWYAKKPDWRRYLLMAALFALSLMANPMAVTFPFVLLLLDYWPLERFAFRSSPLAFRQRGESGVAGQARPAQSAERSSGEERTANGEERLPSGEERKANSEKRLLWLLLEKVPLLALSAASSWMTLRAQRAVVQSFQEFSFGNRLANAVVAYGLYLWKTIWPADLALYPHPLGTRPAWQWILSALVLIVITALVLRFRDKRYLPVGWFWFLGTLVPVIGLVQVGEYAMADRYAYIPLIGIFVMIAWGVADWTDAKDVRPAWCVIPALCVLAVLGGVTVHQIGYWESDYDLFARTLALQESPFAHNAVGMALMNPGSEMTQENLANFASEPVRIEEARRHFERALELRQDADTSLWDKARTLNNLGNLDRMQNRLDEAREHNGAAIAIYRQLAAQNPEVYLPYLAAALNNVASVDRQQHRLDDAEKGFAESLKINRQLAEQNPEKYLPNVAMVLNELGLANANQNRMQAARADYDEALRINRQLAQQTPEVYLPQLAMTLENFALLNAFDRRMDEARQQYEEALQIDRRLAEQNPTVYLPDLAMTLSNLGRVDQLQGRTADARDHYTEAYNLMQQLSQGSNAYAAEMSRIEASLQELQKMPAAQSKQ